MKKINVILFGATGSVGNSTISVIRKNRDKINLEGISCDKKIKKLINIAKEFNVKKIGINNLDNYYGNKKELKKFDLYSDVSSFSEMVSSKTDIIILAISGLNPLKLVIKLLRSRKIIGLANKECIISLGKNIMKIAKKNSTKIVPLDSEHNSIFHLLKLSQDEFKSITITASGGPFFNLPLSKFKNISVKQALSHPIWRMGKKITIDSSTMMNKALEIIEAQYLFNLKPSQINAVIHPQSIVHALINYGNGISTAILNEPNMKIPISSLFFNFKSYNNSYKEFKLSDFKKFEFYEIDKKKFPAIDLGKEVMDMEGIAPHVFNYLNEILVNLFLKNTIKFEEIVSLNKMNLELYFKFNRNLLNPNIDDIYEANKWIDSNINIKK